MNPLLFGRNSEQNIVAVHTLDESTVRVYKRSGSMISFTDEEIFPFFHLSESRFISGFSKTFWLKQLEGSNFYQYICAFQRVHDMWDAVRHVLEKINESQERRIDSYADAEQIFLRPDTNTQFLMQ